MNWSEVGRLVESDKPVTQREWERQLPPAARWVAAESSRFAMWRIYLGLGGDRGRRCRRVDIHINRRAEIVPGINHVEEIERLDGLHKAGCRLDLLGRHRRGGQLGECPEYDVTSPDIGIGLRRRDCLRTRRCLRPAGQPGVQSQSAGRRDRSCMTPGRESPAPSHIRSEPRYPRREPKSMPVAAARTRARVGWFSSSSCPGLFRSGTSSVLHPLASSSPVSAVMRKRSHGSNPQGAGLEADVDTLSQKLRLGGNGATSMFRAIGWLPKLLTSGSSPSYGATRNRFSGATETGRTGHLATVRRRRCRADYR